jgi:hypothetical protein
VTATAPRSVFAVAADSPVAGWLTEDEAIVWTAAGKLQVPATGAYHLSLRTDSQGQYGVWVAFPTHGEFIDSELSGGCYNLDFVGLNAPWDSPNNATRCSRYEATVSFRDTAVAWVLDSTLRAYVAMSGSWHKMF